jgi:hypothetical protein
MIDSRDAGLWLRWAEEEAHLRADVQRKGYAKRLWRIGLGMNLPLSVREAFTMAMRTESYVAARALIWPYMPVPMPRPIFRLVPGCAEMSEGHEMTAPRAGNPPKDLGPLN